MAKKKPKPPVLPEKKEAVSKETHAEEQKSQEIFMKICIDCYKAGSKKGRDYCRGKRRVGRRTFARFSVFWNAYVLSQVESEHSG